MKRFVLAFPLITLVCGSCSQNSIQSLSTHVGETESLSIPTPTPTAFPTPTLKPLPVETPVPLAVPQSFRKPVAIPTFPLPPRPKGKVSSRQFDLFAADVLKQLEIGRKKIIKASHKIAGEYDNAYELIYDKALFRESISKAAMATDVSINDCRKWSQYAKNALSALAALDAKNAGASSVQADIQLQFPGIISAFATFADDLEPIRQNLSELAANSGTSDVDYLEESLQIGFSSLSKIRDDVVDLKNGVGNLNVALQNRSHSDSLYRGRPRPGESNRPSRIEPNQTP